MYLDTSLEIDAINFIVPLGVDFTSEMIIDVERSKPTFELLC